MRRPPDSVTTNYVQIPRVILEWHQLVMLAVEVMFVDEVPFLVSMARGLNLATTEFTPSRHKTARGRHHPDDGSVRLWRILGGHSPDGQQVREALKPRTNPCSQHHDVSQISVSYEIRTLGAPG